MRFQDRYPAHRAPFPQRIVEVPACFAVLFLVRGLGTEMWTSKKPRRMTTFTDSCSEPINETQDYVRRVMALYVGRQ